VRWCGRQWRRRRSVYSQPSLQPVTRQPSFLFVTATRGLLQQDLGRASSVLRGLGWGLWRRRGLDGRRRQAGRHFIGQDIQAVTWLRLTSCSTRADVRCCDRRRCRGPGPAGPRREISKLPPPLGTAAASVIDLALDSNSVLFLQRFDRTCIWPSSL